LLKDTLTPYNDRTPNMYTPGSNYGIHDHKEENAFPSPFLSRHVSFGLNGAD